MTDFEVVPVGTLDAISAAVHLLANEQLWLNGHPYSRSDASDIERMLWLDRTEQLAGAFSRLRDVLAVAKPA